MQRIQEITRAKSALTRAALLLSLAALLAGCGSEAKVSQEVARPVKVAIAGETTHGRTVSYSGVVRPRIESSVGFRVAGKIVVRLVNVGDRVEAEQVIARLDDTDLRLAENSAKAAVDSARSRRDITRDNLERGKALLPQATISQAAYDNRRNEMDAAASALESAEAQLRQASNAVAYATLKADRAGIVTSVMAEPAQVVNIGQAVVTLAYLGETEVAVAVPEQDAGYLSLGQQAKVSLWAGPRTNIDGRIREIAGQADPASRTYAVRIAVSEAPQAMRFGMTASVTLRIDDEPSALVLPVAALVDGEANPAVFVVDATKRTVQKTPVTVGGTAENGVRIASGLRTGDAVVIAGVQFLRDGMSVRVPGERQQARAGNPT